MAYKGFKDYFKKTGLDYGNTWGKDEVKGLQSAGFTSEDAKQYMDKKGITLKNDKAQTAFDKAKQWTGQADISNWMTATGTDFGKKIGKSEISSLTDAGYTTDQINDWRVSNNIKYKNDKAWNTLLKTGEIESTPSSSDAKWSELSKNQKDASGETKESWNDAWKAVNKPAKVDTATAAPSPTVTSSTAADTPKETPVSYNGKYDTMKDFSTSLTDAGKEAKSWRNDDNIISKREIKNLREGGLTDSGLQSWLDFKDDKNRPAFSKSGYRNINQNAYNYLKDEGFNTSNWSNVFNSPNTDSSKDINRIDSDLASHTDAINQQGETINTQGSQINNLIEGQGTLADNDEVLAGGISDNAAGVDSNSSLIGKNKSVIKSNAKDISTNSSGISQNSTGISSNAASISNNDWKTDYIAKVSGDNAAKEFEKGIEEAKAKTQQYKTEEVKSNNELEEKRISTASERTQNTINNIFGGGNSEIYGAISASPDGGWNQGNPAWSQAKSKTNSYGLSLGSN